jgi:hypothetical protein
MMGKVSMGSVGGKSTRSAYGGSTSSIGRESERSMDDGESVRSMGETCATELCNCMRSDLA